MSVGVSREDAIDAALMAICPLGDPVDLGLEDLPDPLPRFLLVERNRGSASSVQSHYFSAHESLDAAGQYHVGQDLAGEWEALYAIDLDAGTRHAADAKFSVEWGAAEQL
jgi:hypothetical protein